MLIFLCIMQCIFIFSLIFIFRKLNLFIKEFNILRQEFTQIMKKHERLAISSKYWRDEFIKRKVEGEAKLNLLIEHLKLEYVGDRHHFIRKGK